MAQRQAVVLDSWIVVAWLRNQRPGADLMEELWRKAEAGASELWMGVVNGGEVYYVTARRRGLEKAEEVIANLRERGVHFVPATDTLVWEACRLKARYPISLGDAFAAATAIRRDCALATGDPEMRRLEADGLLRLEWAG